MAASILADLEARLEADGTLMAIATGGVHTAAAGRGPIRLDGAMYVADSQSGVKELAPCIVINRSSGVPAGPRGAWMKEYYRIGFYEADGYLNTAAMMERVRAILHDTVDTLDNGCTYVCNHFSDSVRESMDETVMTGAGKQGASYEAATYEVVRR